MTYGMSSTGLNPSTTATGGQKEKIPSGYKKASLQNFTPEQMQLFGQLFGHLGPDSFLSKLAGGDQATFDEVEKPALQQFAGLQEGIANKFSGAGLGGRRSSGFQNAQTSAAGQFAQQLQSQRQSLQQQALSDLMGHSNMLLGQKPFENAFVKKDQGGGSGGGWGALAGGVLGAGVGLLGGPIGAMQGAQLGYGVGSQF
jgi:hypothetical protein